MSKYDDEVNGTSVETALGGLGAAGAAGAGIFAGQGSPVANLEKLEQAKRMYDSFGWAKDPKMRMDLEEQVWKSTGWFKGSDGNWKFEIPEADATFRFPQAGAGGIDQPLGASEAGRVKHFVDFPAAFEAFPGMADVRMIQRPMPEGMHGMLTKLGLGVGSHLNPLEATITTGHELEHLGQDVSGFARGGTPESAARDFPQPASVRGDFGAYEALGGEADARLVESRLRRHLGGELDVYSNFPMREYDVPPEAQLFPKEIAPPVPVEKYLQGLSSPQTILKETPPITGRAEIKIPGLPEGSTAKMLMSFLKRALR